MSDTVNAMVHHADVGFEGHGILTFAIGFDFGAVQGFECYSGAEENWKRIEGVLNAIGVTTVSELKGKYCRIKRESGKVVAVGHIVENRWFNW